MKCQALDENSRLRKWFYIDAGNVGVNITVPSGEKYYLVRDQVLEAIEAVGAAKQNVRLTASGAGWRVRLGNWLIRMGESLIKNGGR